MRRLVQAVLVAGLIALSVAPATGQTADEVERTVRRLVADLGSDSRDRRVAARDELLAMGEPAWSLLESAAQPVEFEPREAIRYILRHRPRRARTVSIAAGQYTVGSRDLSDRNPARTLQLEAFTIDDTEVTCLEYFEFVRATKTAAPPHWRGGRYVYGAERLPVRNVSFAEARRFAAWVGGRLPSADEWEVAGHGGQGWPFPWGTQQELALRCLSSARVRPVANLDVDKSPTGCFDLAASVSEWVVEGGKPAFRGGHFLCSRADQLRVTRRRVFDLTPDDRSRTAGFRVVNRRR